MQLNLVLAFCLNVNVHSLKLKLVYYLQCTQNYKNNQIVF